MSDRYRPPPRQRPPRSYRGSKDSNSSRYPPPGASSRYNERDNYRPKIHGPTTQSGPGNSPNNGGPGRVSSSSPAPPAAAAAASSSNGSRNYHGSSSRRPPASERPRGGPSGPSGPSGAPPGPSQRAGSGGREYSSGSKRSFPSEPRGYKEGPGSDKRDSRGYKDGPGPEKRKRHKASSYKPKSQFNGGVNLNNAPKGPRSVPASNQGPRSSHGGPGGRDFSKKPASPSSLPANKRKGPSAPTPMRKLHKTQLYSIRVTQPHEIYQRIQQVGEGTYGKVYKAQHSMTKHFVALKKLRLESEREGFPITAMREIKLLQSFDHKNIVGLLEMMIEHNQIYMVLDYMDHDLTGLLTHPDLKLEESHRKYLFKQLMEGLNYLHKKRVIHRDIKGSNILLDNKGTLKIADFGLARTMKLLNTGESPDYTNRVITIWYRPPELLLGATDYGREVDIWGVGCLLIELYSKIATFQGIEEISQLYKIFDLMGTPTLESWPQIEGLPWFEMLKPKVNKVSRFAQEYKPIMSAHGFDLAEKLLSLNPANRLTASEALEHPYFTEDPQPAPLDFLKDVKGEWHEFETKKRRRQERKRLQDAQREAQQQQKQDQQKSEPEPEQRTKADPEPVQDQTSEKQQKTPTTDADKADQTENHSSFKSTSPAEENAVTSTEKHLGSKPNSPVEANAVTQTENHSPFGATANEQTENHSGSNPTSPVGATANEQTENQSGSKPNSPLRANADERTENHSGSKPTSPVGANANEQTEHHSGSKPNSPVESNANEQTENQSGSKPTSPVEANTASILPQSAPQSEPVEPEPRG